VGKVSAAERAGRPSAAKAAGTQLAAAAEAALKGPMPPVDAAAYQSALKRLEAAGRYVASGKSGKATKLLNTGEIGIMKVTAAADAAVAVKTPTVPEPGE
jgi:hypothetical protein